MTQFISYTTWFADGRTERSTEEDARWILLYQFLFGGQVFLDVTDFESLEKTLGEACFKFEYRPPATELSCDAKSAILMKYLTERF
ncbi:MAG: hypothetical protein ACLFU9_07525 [Candidatus Bathyarchaeia archaeon]